MKNLSENYVALFEDDDIDPKEYDYEGNMAKSQLITMADAAEELHDMLDDKEKMDTWRVGSSPASARPMVDKQYVFIAEHDGGFTDPVIKTVTKRDKTLKITY